MEQPHPVVQGEGVDPERRSAFLAFGHGAHLLTESLGRATDSSGDACVPIASAAVGMRYVHLRMAFRDRDQKAAYRRGRDGGAFGGGTDGGTTPGVPGPGDAGGRRCHRPGSNPVPGSDARPAAARCGRGHRRASPGDGRGLADARHVQRRGVPHRPVVAGAVGPAPGRRPARCRSTAARWADCRSTSKGCCAGCRTKFGDRLNPLELVALPLELHRLVDANEDYWERGDGRRPPPHRRRATPTSGSTAGTCVTPVVHRRPRRGADRRVAGRTTTCSGAKPVHDNDIAARSVLAAFGPSTPRSSTAASWHGDDGGIGTLVVALGANNALAPWSTRTSAGPTPATTRSTARAATTSGGRRTSRSSTAALVDAVRPIDAHRVVLATVPHVTIAPIAKGVNPDAPGQKWRAGSRYFPYYTDPWIDESRLRPDQAPPPHPPAGAGDRLGDRPVQRDHRRRRAARPGPRAATGTCSTSAASSTSLAYRRYIDDDPRRPTQRLGARTRCRRRSPASTPGSSCPTATAGCQGGLFGLDGIHPTISGYGIVAGAVLDVLAAAGVDAEARSTTRACRASDTLDSDPPGADDHRVRPRHAVPEPPRLATGWA